MYGSIKYENHSTNSQKSLICWCFQAKKCAALPAVYMALMLQIKSLCIHEYFAVPNDFKHLQKTFFNKNIHPFLTLLIAHLGINVLSLYPHSGLVLKRLLEGF